MVAAPSPAISSGCREYQPTALERVLSPRLVRTVDLYGAVTYFSIRAIPAGEHMGLGADQLEALAECIDLVNIGRRFFRGSSDEADELADVRGVIAFARRFRVENRSAVRAIDAPRLRELRARLDAIVVACEAGREERAIRALNTLLAETGAVPRIVAHDGRPPHIHVSS